MTPPDEQIFLGAGALLYLAAFVVALVSMLRGRPLPRMAIFGPILVAFGLQTIGLYKRGLEIGSCPVGNPFETLHFIAWSLMLIYMLVGPVFRTSLLGFFSSALAAVMSLLAFMPDWDNPHPPLFGGNPLVESHAALAVFSYGVFGLLAVTSVMYLLQHFALKRKRARGLYSFLPSIAELESINLRLLVVSLIFFTPAVLLGAVVWWEVPESVTLPKLLLAWGTWLGYLIALVLRSVQRLHTSRFALVGIGLFLIALVTLVAVEYARPVATETAAVAALQQ